VMNEASVIKHRVPEEEAVEEHPWPCSRMSHVAGIYGGCLVVHGGYLSTDDKILDDFAIFDIAEGKWVKCKQPKSIHAYIEARSNHTMTVV
jgi:hypothetical protein